MVIKEAAGKKVATNSIFVDGGLVGKNPSSIGGTWAWCLVDDDGQRTEYRSGVVTPELIGLPRVTNNFTELYAVLMALESLPFDWQGELLTDSRTTWIRLRYRAKMNGIPSEIVEWFLDQKRIHPHVKPVLIGGHPTQKELRDGHRADGTPVSVHNVFCDKLCRQESERFMKGLVPT